MLGFQYLTFQKEIMADYYLPIKHLHMTCAYLSITFFLIRAFWSITGSGLLQKGFVKVAPHVIDSILLICGFTLAAVIGPNQPFILAKIVALIAYIGVGTIAIKRGKTPAQKLIATVIASLIFLYIIGAAINKSALSWFI